MNGITHLFFDLDHTLWDTDLNAQHSLTELFVEHELESKGIPSFDAFHACYRQHNERLWGLYSENQIGKEAVRVHRFRNTLKDFNIDDDRIVSHLADAFVERTPYKSHLIEGALELLERLKGRFTMAIITNGFKEVQYIKLRESGLAPYFEKVYISEEVGINKPDPEIFLHAMRDAGAPASEKCVMIGDTYQTDIIGALRANMHAVHYVGNNGEAHPKPVITVRRLEEIGELLR